MPLSPPKLLALCSASNTLSVAAASGEHSSTLNLPGGAEASQRSLAAVQRVLQDCGIALRELDAVAVGIGPGAFTGVRGACAVAQGLAFGASLPVLPLCSLMVLAEDLVGHIKLAAGDVVDVLVDARLQELYFARYVYAGPGHWRAAIAPALWRPDQTQAHAVTASPPQHRVGNGLALVDLATWPPATAWPEARDRAAALLRLAQGAWARGEVRDAAQAQPLYLRDKVALTTAERAALASSNAPALGTEAGQAACRA